MKQVWRFTQHCDLLVSKCYNLRGGNLMCFGTQNKNVAHLSYGMRGFIRAKIPLFQGCSWKIGNGRKVNAFSSKWVGNNIPQFPNFVNLRILLILDKFNI